MRSVTYSMGVSLDGYIVGPDGNFGWTMPDEEVFRFVTDEIRQVGVQLMGRAPGGLAEEIERLRAEPAKSPRASAGWISNSSRTAPSARESSTSTTAWRVSRLVRRAVSGQNSPHAVT
jgi:hypothetical protein